VTPTSALSAALFYVTNKTTTTFDVTYLAGIDRYVRSIGPYSLSMRVITLILLFISSASLAQPIVNAGSDKTIPAFGTINGNNFSTDTIRANQVWLMDLCLREAGFAIHQFCGLK